MDINTGIFIGIGLTTSIIACVMLWIDFPLKTQPSLKYRIADLQKQIEILQESMDDLQRVLSNHIMDGDGK